MSTFEPSSLIAFVKPVLIVKSYHADLGQTNPGKLDVLDQLQHRLAREAKLIASFVERRVLQTGDLPSQSGTLKFRNIPLIAWAQPLYSHVVAQWKSWLENRRNAYNKLVYHFLREQRFPEALRHELLLTGKARLWMVRLDQGPVALGEVTFTPEGRSWARLIWKAVLRGVRKPSFVHVPLHLDGRMAKLIKKTQSLHGSFTHWLHLKVAEQDPTWKNWPRFTSLNDAIVDERIGSTKSDHAVSKEGAESRIDAVVDSESIRLKRKRKARTETVVLHVPVNIYGKAEKAPGEQNQTLALLPPRDDRSNRTTWKLGFSKSSTPDQWADPSPEAFRVKTLGLDLGLNTLLATSEGDLVEPGWKKRLERWDEKLVKLTAGRQRHGLKVRCKAYDQLIRKVRDGMTTRIGQALKSLIEKHRPEVVVMEHLRFQGSSLSKRMNRLITNFGKGLLDRWFREHAAIYGYRVEFVNPAFTSQECSSCGYVDSRNRQGSTFKCLCCGFTHHSDLQASLNVRERFTRTTASPAGSRLPSTLPLKAELWWRPGQVYAWLFQRWWQREACSKEGRLWSADGTRAQCFARATLEQNPTWQTYGQTAWLDVPNDKIIGVESRNLPFLNSTRFSD